MYKGYNLKLDWESPGHYEIGNQLYNDTNAQIRSTLKNFISANGIVQATKLQENWFPQINADVFISHSHKDRDMAIALAGLLSHHCKLNVFIDSCIWGHADELLKEIDNIFCHNDENDTYFYEKRNISTSHVHMMLSTALTMMMDRSECLFFLNTPNSIQSKEIMARTVSPWLYAELSMSKLIRQRKLSEYRKEFAKSRVENKTLSEDFHFEYDISLDHLQKLSGSELHSWIKNIGIEDDYPLDGLYELKSKKKLLFNSIP